MSEPDRRPYPVTRDLAPSMADLFTAILRGGLKSIPVLGPFADQATFGPFEDLRMKRLEMTLTEVAEALQSVEGQVATLAEEFANLVEAAVPSLSRAVREEKRARFRDLFINAAPLPAGDVAWEETMMVSRLLSEIDAPGISLLVALSQNVAGLSTLTAKPSVRMYDVDVGIPDILARPEALGVYHEIPFAWPVVDEWMIRLSELRLVYSKTNDAGGGYGSVSLRALGRMLVHWAVRGDDTAVDPREPKGEE